MPESPDSAMFTAEVTAGQSRAARVQHSEARATLARSRGEEFQFRERSADVPGAPEWSRDRPLAARDRISPPPPAPQPDAPTWADERASVLEAIQTWADEREVILEVVRGLRELCEALSDQLAEMRHEQKRELGMFGAWRALKQWGDAECARIEKESLQQQREEEPLGLPSLHSLRPQ